MEITMIVTQWVGLAIGLLLAVALFLHALGAVIDKTTAILRAYLSRRIDAYLRECAIRMESSAYWFNTAEQIAMWLALADSLKYSSVPDAAHVRDHVYQEKLKYVIEQYPIERMNGGKS